MNATHSTTPSAVRLIEVGPRDGLQNEKTPIATADKLALIQRLIDCGCQEIEATAFVSPKWVPQMADHQAVMAALRGPMAKIDTRAVRLSALTPNLQGAQAALAAGVDEIVIFSAASESFTQKNINCSIAESLARFGPVAEAVRAHNQTQKQGKSVRLRGSISCTVGCPYEGKISPTQVVPVVEKLAQLGCDEIDIADTIGVGTPHAVQAVLRAVSSVFPVTQLAGHFHDTYGQALANIYASLEVGVRTFHASVGGLGGCPYAVGATGNVATEDVVFMLEGLGVPTGISLDKLALTGEWISGMIGKPNASRAGRAWAQKLTRKE